MANDEKIDAADPFVKDLPLGLREKLEGVYQRGAEKLEKLAAPAPRHRWQPPHVEEAMQRGAERLAEIEEATRAMAAPLVERKAWVLHLGSGVVGQAVKLHEPKAEPPLTVHVLELDTGDRFIVYPEAFTVLSEEERGFLEVARAAVGRVVGAVIGDAAMAAKGREENGALSLPRAVQLLGSVLATQLRVLHATGKGEEVPG